MDWLTLPRINWAHRPTPIVRYERLSERLGVDLCIKRDDASCGVEAGNKVRKLEYLLAEAQVQRADVVLTCGAVQSNHARATAAMAAALGIQCELFLWSKDLSTPPPIRGNLFLDMMLGATLHFISREQYGDRMELMAHRAEQLQRQDKRVYVIPEGGSNALGAIGYVQAMREVRLQLDLGHWVGHEPFDLIVHACGSGGTAAGIALGAGCFHVAKEVRPVAVCNDKRYFEELIGDLIQEAQQRYELAQAAPVHVDDASRGPAYGVASAEQRQFVLEMARSYGLVLDPVYTGKALYGLAQMIRRERTLLGRRVLFVHTGGLPGLLAQAEDFAQDL